MAKPKVQKYKLLPEWTISQTEKSLLISGGADARYEIELDSDEKSFFSSLKSTQTFTRNDISSKDKPVLEELITAEIVVPVLQKSSELKVATIGDSNQLKLNTTKDKATVDFVIVVRASSTYADLLEKIDYQNLVKPHLFVDIAFHHTFSVGPLVFPGETACIACLQGRITTRWGDEKPPTVSSVTSKYSSVVSELIKTELDRINNGDTSLTNKTVSWNFQDRVAKSDQLLKVPLCPICTKNKIDHSGALALPWGER